MGNDQKITIGIDELRPGHYVNLDVAWMDHPFLFSRFMVSSQEDIAAIRALGLPEITIVPARSNFATVEADRASNPANSSDEAAAPDDDGAIEESLWNSKQALIDRDETFRKERLRLAVRYQDTVKKVSNFARDLRSGPANAVHAADEIVDEMLSAFENASEVLVNLVNLSDANFTMYTHSLNVTVLSVLLARYLKLDGEEIRSIGMGALVHDIGKIEIPPQISGKIGKLTRDEEALMRTHPLKGLRLARKIREFAPEVEAIIEQHHEYIDGSGYPRGLKDHQLWLSVRIVAITNTYDNLCNPPDPRKAVSPRDAMAALYKTYAGKLDADLVRSFIKAMGVYPPGTIVRLSDDNVGMVVSVDPEQLLRPRVIIHNPDIPRWNAMMVDLRERKDLDIKDVMKPSECPPELYEYLGISERLGYFYESH